MCNAAHLAEYTFVSLYPILSLYPKKKTCKVCDFSNKRKFTAFSINIDIIMNKSLQSIQETLNDTLTLKQTCVKCNNSCDIKLRTTVIIKNNSKY